MVKRGYILVYSTYNEDKSVVALRFTSMLKSEIYKKITANESINQLNYALIKEVNFIKTLCENGQVIMIFLCAWLIMKMRQ